MPIKMSCPSCGKTLSAPDSAEGKKAKCPGCDQTMLVPSAAPAVEEFDFAAASEPAAVPAGNWAGGTASPAPAAAPGSEARQPCPECGEMIVVGAAKCRFCNAIFDPAIKKLVHGGNSQLKEIAKYQRGLQLSLLALFLGYVLAGFGRASMSVELTSIAGLVVLGSAIAGLVFVILVDVRISSIGSAIVSGILMFVPCVNILVLLRINQAATKRLQENGIKVGFLGADMSQF